MNCSTAKKYKACSLRAQLETHHPTHQTMAHYPRTPRTRTPMLAPQPAPVLYASVGTAPYQSPGSHYPGPQLYHVAASEPYSRGRHRSSSRSRNHRRSNSSGGGRHHRHRHRSSTPSRSMPSHYSPGAQYAVSRSHVSYAIGKCKSNSKFSGYSLHPSPPSLNFGGQP